MSRWVAGGSAHGLTSGQERLVLVVDRAIYRVAHRWLWFANGVASLFVALPLLAPSLMATGHRGLALWIYRTFHLVCSQIPSHSFFVFGYQMGICERDTAIYGGTLALGLLYGLFRRRVRPLRWRYAVLLSLPMALDGFTQLFGWRQSDWQLRVVTGGLFALAVVWVVFPLLDQGFREIEQTLRARFDRLAHEGRVRPL